MGGTHPAMLAACARYAACWNTTPVSLTRLREQTQAVDAACTAIGRAPTSLARSLEIQILIAPDQAGIRDTLQSIAALTPDDSPPDPTLRAFIDGKSATIPDTLRETTIVGTPADVVASLRAYVDAGISQFMLWFLDVPSDAGMRLFASEVLPHFSGAV
jgi:alkanesulfonate monooxygenase SsuD/methylene tetrahydromethanopterin reductase-like flavin-dependent oxidoreductase (luciferase family)